MINDLQAAWTTSEVCKFKSVAYVLRSEIDHNICLALNGDNEFDIVEVKTGKRLPFSESPFSPDDNYDFRLIWEAPEWSANELM